MLQPTISNKWTDYVSKVSLYPVASLVQLSSQECPSLSTCWVLILRLGAMAIFLYQGMSL